MHIVFVYTEAEMHILHIIQLILLFPFVCEPVGEVEWKRGPELPPPYPTRRQMHLLKLKMNI